jgi:hypothetical protein
MRKLIVFFSLSLFFVSCNPQGGGGTQPEPYKRPFPTKAYYNGDLKKTIVLDSNSRVIQFTNYSTSTQNQDYVVKYDNQGRIDSVYREFNQKKLGTYYKYPSLDSLYVRRFNDTTWDYDYGLRFSSSNIEYMSAEIHFDWQWEIDGDSITETQWLTNQTPNIIYEQNIIVLGDSVNPLWVDDNPFFSWYYFYDPGSIFSSRMPMKRYDINSNLSTISDNFYDSEGRLIERRETNSNGDTYTMEFSYN